MWPASLPPSRARLATTKPLPSPRALIHGFALTESNAWPILQTYNTRCEPPWSDTDLRHKLRDATTHAAAHKRPRGHLLTKPSAGERIAQPRKHATPFPTALRSSNLDPRGRLGQIRLRDLPELPPICAHSRDTLDLPKQTIAPSRGCSHPRTAISAAVPSADDPPREDKNLGVESSAFDVRRSPATVGARPGPTIQLPRSPLLIDPRTDPLTEWIHIKGYASIPPKNCPFCWLHRGRSLWIGACLCW